MKPSLEELLTALWSSWGADTAYDASDWSEENPARGQCVVSALVVQDYLGGDFARYEIDEGDLHETHYVNKFANGVVLDTTASQYTHPVNMRMKPVDLKGYATIRDKRLADTSTRTRYELLKSRVAQTLQSSEAGAPLTGKYRHYKGNEYELISVGTHTENEEKMVIYKALYAPYETWVRPYEMFFETVEVGGKEVPRFTKLSD